MKNTVIAISRQYGSGGRELANILAEKLGYKLYDRQIVHMAAAQLGISDMNETQLKEFEDKVPPLSLKFMPFYIFGMSGAKPMNHKMFEQEAEIVRRLANDGSCIILGRCADVCATIRMYVPFLSVPMTSSEQNAVWKYMKENPSLN